MDIVDDVDVAEGDSLSIADGTGAIRDSGGSLGLWERSYAGLIFLAASVLLHLAVVFALGGLRLPGVAAPRVSEIEIGRENVAALDTQSRTPPGPGRWSPIRARAMRGPTPQVAALDPFATAEAMRLRRELHGEMPQQPRPVASTTGLVGGGQRGTGAQASGPGFGSGGGPPQRHFMRVYSYETPVRSTEYIRAGGRGQQSYGAAGGAGGAQYPAAGAIGDPSRAVTQAGGGGPESPPAAGGVPVQTGTGASDIAANRQATFTPARPRTSFNPNHGYPDAARLQHEQGTVMLRIHVTAQGLPQSVEIVASSGYAQLDADAVAAVRNWTFYPAMNQSGPVDSWLTWPYTFGIR